MNTTLYEAQCIIQNKWVFEHLILFYSTFPFCFNLGFNNIKVGIDFIFHPRIFIA